MEVWSFENFFTTTYCKITASKNKHVCTHTNTHCWSPQNYHQETKYLHIARVKWLFTWYNQQSSFWGDCGLLSELLLYFRADTAAPGIVVADSCHPGRSVCYPVILLCTHPGFFVLPIVPHHEVSSDLNCPGSQIGPSLSPHLPTAPLWWLPQKCKNWWTGTG